MVQGWWGQGGIWRAVGAGRDLEGGGGAGRDLEGGGDGFLGGSGDGRVYDALRHGCS